MFHKAISIVTTISLLLLGGCATNAKMALSKGSESIENPVKAIYLLSATLKNSYATSHQPKLIEVNVERDSGATRADRLRFKIDDRGRIESKSTRGNTYLLRMELQNGEYVIRGLTSHSRSLLIHAKFFTPIHANIVASTPGIFYLGHIEANIREREENEFKAGPLVPLIDQAIAGASTGTFDIEITDQWTQDEVKFKSRFPTLVKANIQKTILPAFDRNKAQNLWEAD